LTATFPLMTTVLFAPLVRTTVELDPRVSDPHVKVLDPSWFVCVKPLPVFIVREQAPVVVTLPIVRVTDAELSLVVIPQAP